MRIFFILVLSVVMLSCGRENLKYEKDYVDFDSLINKQIQLLTSANITIGKNASITDSSSVGNIKADSVTLSRELDIFRQIDLINRPLFKGQYEVSESEDIKSNLTVRTYRAKIKSPIPEVRFYFLNNIQKLKRIEARYEEENTLYYTRRDYVLEFAESDPKLLYKSSVKGMQKMILNDSIPFAVESVYTVLH